MATSPPTVPIYTSLPSSSAAGAIDSNSLRSEYIAANSSSAITMNSLYSGSIYSIGGSIPASGQISFSNFYGSRSAKGIFEGGATNYMYAINFNTDAVRAIATLINWDSSGGQHAVNSSTKMYGIATNSTNKAPAFNFTTETLTTLTGLSNPSPASGGTGTASNSSTTGYAYFDQQNANSVPTLPTNKTNVVKFTFASETFSAGGSTTGCLFVNYSSSQSSTKGYTGGYGYWTGDLYNPIDNVVNSIMGLIFASDTASSIGKTLPGTTRFGSATGNSTIKSYFYGGITGIQSSTPQSTITGMPFSTETPVNLSASLPTAVGNQGAGGAICSAVKNYLGLTTSWNTLDYATETYSSFVSSLTNVQAGRCGQPYNIMP